MYTARRGRLCALFELQDNVPEALQELQTRTFRGPEDGRSNPVPFCFQTFSHTSHIHYVSWMSRKVNLFSQQQPVHSVMAHNAFYSLIVFLINKTGTAISFGGSLFPPEPPQ